jgi:hypothetical protein
MERVEALRQKCGGRADRLLEEIAALPRFRARLEFRAFLEREGYLDPRDPLDDAGVRAALLAALGPDLRAGVCTAPDVERLLALVPAEG